ncbi:MAG: NACHT domain-containing protein [Chitinophagaceae bacterium]|nr:NACHT domain-containing protein [Chitinophagaceae bacterium]
MDITFQERISQQAKSSFISKLFDFQHSIINQFTETQTLLHKDLVPFLDIYQPLTIINKYEFLVTSGVAEKLFTLNPMVVLWGNAGNGKTTIVKYLFIDSTLTSYKIPILLNLRDIIIPIKKQDKNQPENIIYDHILNHLNFSVDSVDAIIIKEMLKYGKFLILLDGYDETDYDKSNILNTEIHDFSLRYNDCAYFMTSRFDSKATSLLSFKPYQIMPFDKSEIKSFIRRQFLNKTARIDEIIATVFKAENSRYLEYLENPLFLLLFLNSFDIYPNIPPKKVDSLKMYIMRCMRNMIVLLNLGLTEKDI